MNQRIRRTFVLWATLVCAILGNVAGTVGTTEYGDIKPRTAGWICKKMLLVGKPLLVSDKFGQIITMPKNESENIVLRRYTKLPITGAKVPMAEGVTPDATQLTKEDVVATLLQYGAWVQISDKIEDLHDDPILNIASERLGEQAAETIDSIRFDYLVAGTSVQYANGALRTSVNTVIDRGDIRIAQRTLARNLSKFITRLISPSPDFGTAAVEAGYWAVTHVDLEHDIRSMSGFINAKDYPRGGAIEGEIGAVDKVRFVTTTQMPYWTGGGAAGGTNVLETGGIADVYPVLIFARDAYAIIPLAGKNSLKVMVLNPNVPRGGDPLGQRGSAAWKTMQTVCILNDSWMTRIETACTSVPT